MVKNNFTEQMGSELPLKNGHAFDRPKTKGDQNVSRDTKIRKYKVYSGD